jgi:hypothetical protein
MVGVDSVFNSKVKNNRRAFQIEIVQFNSAANNAFAKCGQTMELQHQQHCRFGLGLDR